MKDFFLYGYFVILAILSVFGVHRYYTVHLFRKYKNAVKKPEKNFEKKPHVTIQLPIFNERYVTERLIDAVCNINYPKEFLEIQVLDDSTDDTSDIAEKKVNEKKKEGFDISFIHRNDRSGFKAGALEAGLKVAKGDFVAIFDADFIPPTNFLESTIDFFTDKKIGMVQTRWDHENRGFSILTECQSILLDGHFMLEHTARNRSGRFFNFNGTAGIWRKETIRDAGGWQHDTLTEDLDLSYRAQIKGWQFIYLPEITVPAELPVEMRAFKSQQFRWAKGSIQVFLKLFPTILRSNLPFKVKLEAFFHLAANFAYLLMVVLCCMMPMNIFFRYGSDSVNLKFLDLPIFFFATASVFFFYFYSEFIVFRETASVKDRNKLPVFFYIPFTIAIGIGLAVNNAKAVIEALRGKVSPFVRTPKYNVIAGESVKNSVVVSKVSKNIYSFKGLDLTTMIELLFGLYFSFTVFFAFYIKSYTSVPFLMLFQIGFLYTSLLSISGKFRNFRRQSAF